MLQAADRTFPNLPPAAKYQSRTKTRDKARDQASNHEAQEIDSVVIYGGTPGPSDGELVNQAATFHSFQPNRAGIDVSKLATELADIQGNQKYLAKENRIAKRQYCLLLDVQAQEIGRLETELRDSQTKNEELLRLLDQAKPSNRRSSQVHTDDIHQLESQGRMIQSLKSKFHKACQINQLMDGSSRKTWSRGPLESEAKLFKIEKGIIRLANSLVGLILRPEELENSLKECDNGVSVVELLDRSIGDVQSLFVDPWLALRSVLFRFVRDRVFYSDLWTTFHCDGLLIREYQRALELCGKLS
jgi:hypothetical protein